MQYLLVKLFYSRSTSTFPLHYVNKACNIKHYNTNKIFLTQIYTMNILCHYHIMKFLDIVLIQKYDEFLQTNLNSEHQIWRTSNLSFWKKQSKHLLHE